MSGTSLRRIEGVTLEYRYFSGNDGSYFLADITEEEREHIEALFKFWDFEHTEDPPYEVALSINYAND